MKDEDSATSDACDLGGLRFLMLRRLCIRLACGHSNSPTSVMEMCRCLCFRSTLFSQSLPRAFCVNCARQLLHPSLLVASGLECDRRKTVTIFSAQSLIQATTRGLGNTGMVSERAETLDQTIRWKTKSELHQLHKCEKVIQSTSV